MPGVNRCREPRRHLRRTLQVTDDIAGDGNGGLVAVLFEKQPLQHLCPGQRRCGQIIAPLREEMQDRVGFGEPLTIFQHNQRDFPVRIEGEEFGGPRLPRHHIHMPPVIGPPRQLGNQLHLVAIAGNDIAIDRQHSRLPAYR